MYIIKLREAMIAYRRNTGKRITYEILAKRTGLSRQTFASIAADPDSNPTVQTIEKICIALDVSVSDLLEILPDPPHKTKKKNKKKSRKKVAKKR